jgi:aerobic-type carbon monoxide dehydrogenase small subunit (CoxS/CutS family)
MRSAFASLICRCGSHVRIFEAVRQAAGETKRSA